MVGEMGKKLDNELVVFLVEAMASSKVFGLVCSMVDWLVS